MSYIFKNGSLLWVGGSVASSANCCCDSPVPSDCNGFTQQRARACASDWLAGYPADGDAAAFVASLAGTQMDVTLPTGFGADGTSCPAAVCTGLDGSTHTLPHVAGTTSWFMQIDDYCAGVGRFSLGVSISCGGADCNVQVNMNICNTGGCLSPIWRKTYTSTFVFATYSDTLPRFNSSTGVGTLACTLTDLALPVIVALH